MMAAYPLYHSEVVAKLNRCKADVKRTHLEQPKQDTASAGSTHLLTPLGVPIITATSSTNSSYDSNESRVELPLEQRTPTSSLLLPSAPPPSPGDFLDTELPISPEVITERSSSATNSATVIVPQVIITSPDHEVTVTSTNDDDSDDKQSAITDNNQQALTNAVKYSSISICILLLAISMINPVAVACSITSVLYYQKAVNCYKAKEYDLGVQLEHYGRYFSILSLVSMVVYWLLLLALASLAIIRTN